MPTCQLKEFEKVICEALERPEALTEMDYELVSELADLEADDYLPEWKAERLRRIAGQLEIDL